MSASRRFYLDTAIWRDYFEDRKDGVRPLGEFAFRFLKNCEKHKCTIVIAEPVLFELKDFGREIAVKTLSNFSITLEEAEVSGKQFAEAKRISTERKLPFNDALHAIIARDNEAIMVTRDMHFEELTDIANCGAPEGIIFP